MIFGSLLILALSKYVSTAPHLPRFSSHVSFATPAGSYSHGVGDLEPRVFYGNFGNKPYKRPRYGNLRSLQGLPRKAPAVFRGDTTFRGYPSERPSIPFPTYPSLTQGNSISTHHHPTFADDNYGHVNTYGIPVLPPSPYRVDSPDAESLWPEGLFIPPSVPLVHYGNHDKSDQHSHNYENTVDPYLLQGIEAVEALERLNAHGELFHHEIPHVRALLANQQIRLDNNLAPNRLGSIRTTSPWLRN